MVVPCRGAGRRRGSAADDGSGAEKRSERKKERERKRERRERESLLGTLARGSPLATRGMGGESKET